MSTGMEALVQASHFCVSDNPEEIIDCVLRRLGAEKSTDDVCVLAVRVL